MAATRSSREKFEITESLFADDSTLIGWTSELKLGKEVVKQAMKDCEEKCHDGKEESISFGTEAANKTKITGTRIGRKDDLKARVQRGNAAWYKTKKWLWRSKLSMRTQALVVQAVVESTMLFDCMVHTWTATDIQKMQSVPDNAYQWIWNQRPGETEDAEGARKCIRDKRTTGNLVPAGQDRDENPLQDRSHPTHAQRETHQEDNSRHLGPRTRSNRRSQSRYVIVLAENPGRSRNRLDQH